MSLLFVNIAMLVNVRNESVQLRKAALAELPCIQDAWLLVEGEKIIDFGSMSHLELKVPHLPSNVIDVSGQFVLPCWCDSHTHLVFAGSRENEFIDKIKGLSYAEIAARGGGILNSASKLASCSQEELFESAMERLNEVARLGTGAIEIKSGYGLTVESELKMLRVIRQLKKHSKMIIRSSFLGAHTYPLAFKDNHEGYIQQIIDKMLPSIAAEGLADYIDVFCEEGFFSPKETIRICQAAASYGLKPKLHINQLNSIGGVEAAMQLKAVSVDHLETLTEKDIELLGAFSGCSTLLPTAAFFLRMNYQPARKLIDAGAAVTLASDYNPGSSPSGNMNFVNALSCIQLKMLPEEVINASTINGAFAMECHNEAGSISKGKFANLIFTQQIPSLSYLFYRFGNNHINKVMIKGEWVN